MHLRVISSEFVNDVIKSSNMSKSTIQKHLRYLFLYHLENPEVTVYKPNGELLAPIKGKSKHYGGFAELYVYPRLDLKNNLMVRGKKKYYADTSAFEYVENKYGTKYGLSCMGILYGPDKGITAGIYKTPLLDMYCIESTRLCSFYNVVTFEEMEFCLVETIMIYPTKFEADFIAVAEI